MTELSFLKNNLRVKPDITELLKCEHFFQPYDAYFPPRVLLCCAIKICSTCIQQIEKQVKDNKYKFIVCNEVITMPRNGFQLDRTAARLIGKQPKEISRGLEANKLKQNLNDLENLVNKLIIEMDNGEYTITEDFNCVLRI